MERWHNNSDKHIENEKVDAFLKELFELYEKHNMSISHEDYHGGFEIDINDEHNVNWMKAAAVTEKLELKTNNK